MAAARAPGEPARRRTSKARRREARRRSGRAPRKGTAAAGATRGRRKHRSGPGEGAGDHRQYAHHFEVSGDVTTVKGDVAATRVGAVEKTIANLKATQGDLGVQSGRDRHQRQGTRRAEDARRAELYGVQARQDQEKRSAESGRYRRGSWRKPIPRRTRYTIFVIANDKRVEKRDKTINEPVQFPALTRLATI